MVGKPTRASIGMNWLQEQFGDKWSEADVAAWKEECGIDKRHLRRIETRSELVLDSFYGTLITLIAWSLLENDRPYVGCKLILVAWIRRRLAMWKSMLFSW